MEIIRRPNAPVIFRSADFLTSLFIPCSKKDLLQGVKVVLKELADSALVFKILVWVNVFTQYVDDGEIYEAVYVALNENDIEIPFPQTDVHIKS